MSANADDHTVPVVQYALKIDFERGSRDPSRVFFAMAGIIDAFSQLDSDLLGVFRGDVRTALVLNEVQAGSIESVLRHVLEKLDDDALRSGDWRKVIGCYLCDAKHAILSWCNRDIEIVDPKDVRGVVSNINDMAVKTGFHAIPHYRPYTPRQLLRLARDLRRSTAALLPSENATYADGEEVISVYPVATLSQGIVDEFLVPVPRVQTQTCVLAIKKPDYLGDSKWEFRWDNRTIKASIEDHGWMSSFRRRQFEIKPGDALKVSMESTTTFDDNGSPNEPLYRVLSVLDIVSGDAHLRQPELPSLGLSESPPV